MTVAMAATDLDSRLAGVARQYDDVQAELALPETSGTPTRFAGWVASSPASNRSSPRSATSNRPGASSPAPASCVTPATATTSSARWRRTRSPG